MTCVLEKHMRAHLITSLDAYHRRYGLSHERLQSCGKTVPFCIQPVNRGVELGGELLDDSRVFLVEEQVRNGIPVRMALLYLMFATEDG